MVFWANSHQQHRALATSGTNPLKLLAQREISNRSGPAPRAGCVTGWAKPLVSSVKFVQKARSWARLNPHLTDDLSFSATSFPISLSVLTSKASKHCITVHAFSCLMEITQNSKAGIKNINEANLKQTSEPTTGYRTLLQMDQTIKCSYHAETKLNCRWNTPFFTRPVITQFPHWHGLEPTIPSL